MPNNYLLTGEPGIGKTSLLQKVAKAVNKEGWQAGGIYCPEIRDNGKRTGFEMVDIISHERAILAHVNANGGEPFGKYKVQTHHIAEICHKAFSRAFQEAHYLLIDEIAPMELSSTVFKQHVQTALDRHQPLLAVIHRNNTGFLGAVKGRDDVQLKEMTINNRDTLLTEFTDKLSGHLGNG